MVGKVLARELRGDNAYIVEGYAQSHTRQPGGRIGLDRRSRTGYSRCSHDNASQAQPH